MRNTQASATAGERGDGGVDGAVDVAPAAPPAHVDEGAQTDAEEDVPGQRDEVGHERPCVGEVAEGAEVLACDPADHEQAGRARDAQPGNPRRRPVEVDREQRREERGAGEDVERVLFQAAEQLEAVQRGPGRGGDEPDDRQALSAKLAMRALGVTTSDILPSPSSVPQQREAPPDRWLGGGMVRLEKQKGAVRADQGQSPQRAGLEMGTYGMTDDRTVTLEPWSGPWAGDDPDANFKADVSLYALVDPLATLRTMSRHLDIPLGALCHYVLAKWASAGSGGLLELGPTMTRRLAAVCDRAERGGTDAARLAAYGQLREMIGWLELPLDHPDVYER